MCREKCGAEQELGVLDWEKKVAIIIIKAKNKSPLQPE